MGEADRPPMDSEEFWLARAGQVRGEARGMTSLESGARLEFIAFSYERLAMPNNVN